MEKTMKLPMRLLFAAALLGLLPTSASAQPYDGYHRDKIRAACAADAARVCPHVVPGAGRVFRCLRAREHALNNVCYRAVQVAWTIRVCRVDYHRLCAHVPPGEGRVVRCLERNEPKLNPSCRAEFAKINPPY